MTDVIISSEMDAAVWSTLYHHKDSSPEIVQMVTGVVFETPPPVPTELQKEMAHSEVKKLLRLYHNFNKAMCEVVDGEVAMK